VAACAVHTVVTTNAKAIRVIRRIFGRISSIDMRDLSSSTCGVVPQFNAV
jgi:hypothetical protein